MDTISLRFTNNFAPECGTIEAHETIIREKGYVWYGKMGTAVSKKAAEMIMANKEPKFLLIHSGYPERYWVYVEEISKNTPKPSEFPSYYADKADRIGTWFKVTKFENADSDIMSKCSVLSSGTSLSEASKHSMSPYFMIHVTETNEYNRELVK